jgi:hypothetical protein
MGHNPNQLLLLTQKSKGGGAVSAKCLEARPSALDIE